MICTLQRIAVFVYLKKKTVKNGNIVIYYVYYY